MVPTPGQPGWGQRSADGAKGARRPSDSGGVGGGEGRPDGSSLGEPCLLQDPGVQLLRGPRDVCFSLTSLCPQCPPCRQHLRLTEPAVGFLSPSSLPVPQLPFPGGGCGP